MSSADSHSILDEVVVPSSNHNSRNGNAVTTFSSGSIFLSNRVSSLCGRSCPVWLRSRMGSFDSLLLQHSLAQFQMFLAEMRVCSLSPSADEIVVQSGANQRT